MPPRFSLLHSRRPGRGVAGLGAEEHEKTSADLADDSAFDRTDALETRWMTSFTSLAPGDAGEKWATGPQEGIKGQPTGVAEPGRVH